MLNMLQQERIRDLARKGYTSTEIMKETGFSYPTIRKYLGKDDFSPKRPISQSRPSSLDPYKPDIAAMLEEDKGCYRKQHHTAKRIHTRLRDERGYAGSYSTVQRYVKQLKLEMRAASQQFNDLEWPAGWMQADFGQADFDMPRGRQRMHYLATSFPQSNHGLSQVFGDELAVCVCQGLKDMFEHIEGVPPAIVFDNATEVGRKICGIVKESSLFRAFRLHYGFEAIFTNPYAGHEKGNVENKVGFTRRNLFVPVPTVGDLRQYNKELLDACDGISRAEVHYEKGSSFAELFEADKEALSDLPGRPFDCVSWERRTADGYGKIALKCGRFAHKYLAGAQYAKRPLIVGIRAYEVEIGTPEGEIVRTYPRRTEDAFTNDEDPLAVLDILQRKPAAFKCSSIRAQLSESVCEYLDALEGNSRKKQLSTLVRLAKIHGMQVAANAFEDSLAATGRMNSADIEMTAVRIACMGKRGQSGGIGTKLVEYDAFIPAINAKEAVNG